MSPIQGSTEYRKQQLRTCLGFGVFYKKDGVVVCQNIDLISNGKHQGGYDVVNGFR
jgi:hypothetical protein